MLTSLTPTEITFLVLSLCTVAMMYAMVGHGGGFQGDVETIQFGVLRFKGFLSFLLGHAAVPAEHPVVPGSHGQEHGGIPQVLRSDAGFCFPILPKGGLPDGEGLGRALLLETLQFVQKVGVLLYVPLADALILFEIIFFAFVV